MPTISFHHSVPDKLAAACRLVEDCFQAGRGVLVYAPDPLLAARFDAQLWTHGALSFIPHCRDDAPLAAETPILIAASTAHAAGRPVLLNLSSQVPTDYAQFEEVIEVVSTAADDANPARLRFKTYKEQGHPPQAHAWRQAPSP